MQSFPEQPSKSISGLKAPLQLLLFVDRCLGTTEQIQQIRSYLATLRADYFFDLQVIDVGELPDLAEHFKMVTPALIKIHPGPRQVLAGKNLVTQLENCWPYWQQSVDNYLVTLAAQSNFPAMAESKSATELTADSAELIKLSDEIFQLKQEKADLQEQLRFKDRMIAIMAHDLRNPLTATLIALETLELGLDFRNEGSTRLNPEVMMRLLKHARTQTQAIDQMITDLLQAAQNTSAEFQIQPKNLELGKLCQEVLEHLQSRLHAKSQSIETDIPGDLPCAYADEDRVRQVIVSLLDNAVKYTPAGSLIQIAILRRTSQKIQVSVCDNGPGIPVENQRRIFEDQFRLERDQHQESYGTGLALCRRIIQTHYGQIWVDSKPNQGSCFHFTLPVYRT
jgi:two-component system clock-associated histidine kinase SasA